MMNREEKDIANAIAVHLGTAVAALVTDSGQIELTIPPYRADANKIRAQLDLDSYDVEIVVKKRVGYIG